METLEWIERRAFQSLFCFASPDTRTSLGLKAFESRSLFAGFAPRADMLAMNRVLGLGLGPDSYEVLEWALAMARRSGARRVFLPIPPGPVGGRVGARLADQGLMVHNHWMRLAMDLDQPFHAGYPGTRNGRAEVEPLERRQASAFGALVAEAFHMPMGIAGLLADSVGAPGWVHLGGYWAGELVGAGALYQEDKACWLGFGAVKESYRRRGIQTALIAERLRIAREQGSVVASVETPDGSEGRPSASSRNLLRFGFEFRYRRPNYLFMP